jgi:hypothetical protein
MLGEARMEIDPALGGRAPGHVVHFYQSDAALGATVARFLLAGWRTRQPLIILATRSHRDAIADSLRTFGCDCDDPSFTFADAEETLASFMTGDELDPARFKLTAERLLAQSRRVVFYGEMVDVLWRDGRAGAALKLEELWNDLAGGRSFSMLCGYAIERFSDPDQATGFDAICHLHEHVIDGVHR